MSWGMYPRVESTIHTYDDEDGLRGVLERQSELIAYGNGRSYGDSAISSDLIHVRPHDYFLDFDETTGLLRVQAGALLSEILETFVPRGWFLKVTPGTRLITVGGAIASDVHGKNHHVAGCFSESVPEFRLMLADGEVVTCSRNENTELFRATCGGMGLTGVILDAKIFLQRINSRFIDQVTIKSGNLKETFDAFEKYGNLPYSVAWIDCMSKGASMGRSLLMAGDFRNDNDLDYRVKKLKNIPFNFPGFMMNNWSVRLFNHFYYNRVRESVSRQKVDIDTFFYPLDAIGHWNRIYGKNGFTQYQFILPKNESYEGLEEALGIIEASNKGSFLAVLKLYGPANENWLSFPMEGYSLALDFKIEPGLFNLLDRLDEVVLKHHGRIYLTKDVRVGKKTFEQGYPRIDDFRDFRKKNGMDRKFNSLQSKRVDI